REVPEARARPRHRQHGLAESPPPRGLMAEVHVDAGDLPAPIPWLARPGSVEPLDRARVVVASRPEPVAAPETVAATSAVVPGVAGSPPKPKPKAKAKRIGSGIPARPLIRFLVWARRFVQTAC